MTTFQECLLEALVAYGPILLACLIGAICWLWKRIKGG